jgi:hypothetical protein
MLISENARARARSLSAIGAAIALAMALAAYFGLGDKHWTLIVPVLACAAAAAWPTRIVVTIGMLATAAVVALGLDGSGVLFGGSAVTLMLALNNLQSAATHVGRRSRA